MEINVDTDVQEILLAASNHDIAKLRQLIRSNERNDNIGNPVNVKDPETGFTPLHATIAACEKEDEEQQQEPPNVAVLNGVSQQNGTQDHADGTAGNNNGEGSREGDDELVQSAIEMVRFLLQEGAIWNDLDLNNETPGCIARRLELMELYEMMVDAGVRAELLLNRLDGYEPLEDDQEDNNDIDEQNDENDNDNDKHDERVAENEEDHGEPAPRLVDTSESASIEPQPEAVATEIATETVTDEAVTNPRYLASHLTFQNDRLLDQDQNGVMMSWEKDIMSKSAHKLLPTPGLRVLNIGHGMGIIDDMFQSLSPSSHHIVEAHPAVVEMRRKSWHEKPGIHIHHGKWQDVLPSLVADGVTFDAIYYDTFAEDYSDFRDFFNEQVIGLLEEGGRWGFFNGMGADRQISYDVYQKVFEIDLFEAGFDVVWEDVEVPKLEGEWEGVRRPYWAIKNYRLPLCKYMD